MTQYSSRVKQNEDSADKVTDEVWAKVAQNKKDKINPNYKGILGTFKDKWFGEVVISERKGKLFFESKRSAQLKGEVFFYKDGNYVVKWDNAYFHADAHLFFTFDKAGKAIALKMNPISELTDFSYDFQDLDFTRL